MRLFLIGILLIICDLTAIAVSAQSLPASSLSENSRATGLQDENVKYVFSEAQQGMWLALNNGITRLEIPSPLSHFSERSGLKGSINACQRHQGRLYVATSPGVYYLRPRTRDQASPSHILPPEFQPVAGLAAQSWSLLSVEELLLAGTGESICQIDGDHVTFARPSASHAFVQNIVRARRHIAVTGSASVLRSRRLTQEHHCAQQKEKPKFLNYM
jgi:hypothetical protein